MRSPKEIIEREKRLGPRTGEVIFCGHLDVNPVKEPEKDWSER